MASILQGFHTVSEYIRALICPDQERVAQQSLDAKLLEAVERRDYRDVTPEFWKRLEAIAGTTSQHRASVGVDNRDAAYPD